VKVEMDRERATAGGRIDPTGDEALWIGNGDLDVVDFVNIGS
jgi:hypothetical protein